MDQAERRQRERAVPAAQRPHAGHAACGVWHTMVGVSLRADRCCEGYGGRTRAPMKKGGLPSTRSSDGALSLSSTLLLPSAFDSSPLPSTSWVSVFSAESALRVRSPLDDFLALPRSVAGIKSSSSDGRLDDFSTKELSNDSASLPLELSDSSVIFSRSLSSRTALFDRTDFLLELEKLVCSAASSGSRLPPLK